jgi:hypothetical protein
MDISITFEGLKETIENMDALARKQLPYALKEALNITAADVQKAEVKKMQETLDRPTPYTLKSVKIKSATKAKLEAAVYFPESSFGKGSTAAAKYILPQVAGGARNIKRFEAALQRVGVLPKGLYVAPGQGCELDAYGNIPTGLIVQLLSYFRAFGEQGYRANITDKKKAALKKGSKRKGTLGYEYFVSYGPGTNSGRQHLPAGIYKRVTFAVGSAIKPIFMFVKQPAYSKRFPFIETAQRTVNMKFKDNFNRAMRDALLTARRPG